MTWRNDISFKKRYWKDCVITNLDKNYYQIQDWKNFMQLFIMHQTSFLGAQNIVHENDCIVIL